LKSLFIINFSVIQTFSSRGLENKTFLSTQVPHLVD
jgi:hypothetical protein